MAEAGIVFEARTWKEAIKVLSKESVEPRKARIADSDFLYFDLGAILRERLETTYYAESVRDGARRPDRWSHAWDRVAASIPTGDVPLGLVLFHDRFKPNTFSLLCAVINLPGGNEFGFALQFFFSGLTGSLRNPIKAAGDSSSCAFKRSLARL